MITDETNLQPEEDQPVEASVQEQTAPAESTPDTVEVVTSATEESGTGRKIQIGSRRNKEENDKPQGAKPHVGGKAPPASATERRRPSGR